MNGYLAELIGGLVLAVMGALAGIAAFLAWPLLAKLAMPLLLHLAAPRQAQGLLWRLARLRCLCRSLTV